MTGSRLHLSALLLLECTVLLLLAEGLAAFFDLDNRLLGKFLYYQGSDLEVHQLSDDVRLHYELKPGSSGTYAGGRTVSVNALGFRDPPRTAAKPRDTTRIICIGTSNTYGANVPQAQTYPAVLERLLNGKGPGKYEVWNGGVNAYTLAQNVAAAERALRDYAPDMLIFQAANEGRRAFLFDQPFERFFREEPALYQENLRFSWDWAPGALRATRLFRTLLFMANLASAAADREGFQRDNMDKLHEGQRRVFLDFYEKNKGRVKIILLIYPGAGPSIYKDLVPQGVPTLLLADKLAQGLGQEYREVHPPPHVYRWYAEKLLSYFVEQGLFKAKYGMPPAGR
jgi:hypothetical protein